MKTSILQRVLCLMSTTVLHVISASPMGQWSQWTACSKTCDRGVQTRYRFCSYYPCTGPFNEQRDCQIDICPGRLIEGDIVVDNREDIRETYSIPGDSDTWTSRTIPFMLDITSANAKSDVWTNIKRAMKTIIDKTNGCIQFVPKTESHNDYIKITNRINSGCYSSVGRRGGTQYINIDDSCKSVGIVLHELLHALGFWHEHSRADRDKYIEVKYNNIRIGKADQFRKQQGNTMMEQAVPYDYGSILHYKYNEFAKSAGLDTIVPRQNYNKYDLGQRTRLSDLDVDRLAWLYRCNRYLVNSCRRPLVRVNVFPIKREYAVGETIHYYCDSSNRMYLIGPSASECKDNGQWSGATPVCLTSNPMYTYPLDFENKLKDTCGHDWKTTNFLVHSGPTPSRDTGPHTDHTYQNSTGKYLYLEATKMAVGTKATLDFPTIMTTDCTIISFFYNMYGADIGQLKVTWCRYRVVCQSNFTSASPDNKWRMFKWYPQPNTQKRQYYKLTIEATRGSGDTSDIAIDDVFVGSCDDVNKFANAQVPDNDLSKRSDKYDPTFSQDMKG